MNLLIPTAYAQEAAQQSQPSQIYSLLPFVAIIVLFYLLMWRPQSKRNKEHRQLVDSISRGDEIMTTGGLLGKVTRINDDYVAIEVAKDVEIKIQKSSVHAALPKGTISQI